MSLHRLSHQNIPSVSSSFSVVSLSVSFLSLFPLPLFILLPDYVWTSSFSYWHSFPPVVLWLPENQSCKSLFLLLLLVRRRVNLLLSSCFHTFENTFSFLSFVTKNIYSHYVWTAGCRFALITWKITRLLHKRNMIRTSLQSSVITSELVWSLPEPQTANVSHWALLWKSTGCFVFNFASIVFLLTDAFIVKEQRFLALFPAPSLLYPNSTDEEDSYFISIKPREPCSSSCSHVLFVSEASLPFPPSLQQLNLISCDFLSIRSSFSLQVGHLPLYSSLLEKMSILSSSVGESLIPISLPFFERRRRSLFIPCAKYFCVFSSFLFLQITRSSSISPSFSLSVLAVETRTDWLWDLTRAKTGCQQVMIET